MNRRKKIIVADLLCGAGGSSTGCIAALLALGFTLEQIVLACVNHWPVAIETHRMNHPGARHYVQDIATVRPHLVVPEGWLDLLMASPTCTHHSVARGGKPTSDQQRSDPWHIITWLTELRVERLIIENVWEFIGWGPVDPATCKPIKERKGEYFRAWIETIRRLGYDPEWRKLNAADFGDATTRQRFILMARKDKRTVAWPVPTHAKRQAGNVAQLLKPWKPARDIIDWNIKGRSIFSRKKALAPKTLARIYAGALKYAWPEPFLVVLRNHMGAQSVDLPVPAIMANGKHIGLAEPVMFANRSANAPKDTDQPAPCLTTAPGGGIAIIEPVIISPRHGKKGAGPRPRGASQPLPTITGGGSQFGVAEPIVLSQHNSGGARSTRDPLPTIMTGGAGAELHPGCARPALVEPLIVNRNSAPRGATRAVSEPAPTPTTSGAGYLVEPLILSRHAGGAPRSIDEPTPTQVAKHSLILVAPFYSSGSGETCGNVDAPLPSPTTKGRFGMVVPITHTGEPRRGKICPVKTHGSGTDRARSLEEPIHTITTSKRGELAFITAQHGERPGQEPRVHDVELPAPTIAASGHVDLVEGTEEYDILFRMLEPHELAAAMGFMDDDITYEFAGTKTEKIKQIGNAVSVAKMKACVGALMADAAPKRRRNRQTVTEVVAA